MAEFAQNLGKCSIVGGKETRNHFIYFPLSRVISLDFDSDYVLTFTIGSKNPGKAFTKAKKIVALFLNREVTVDELVAAGFDHDIPDKYYKGLK